MKNELKNINDLKDKTISDLKLDCGELWLKFTDNTFAILVVNDITQGFGHTRYEVNKGKSKKVHLIYGILTTKCGKLLEEVEYTIDVNLCTCKTCLKQKQPDYPRK